MLRRRSPTEALKDLRGLRDLGGLVQVKHLDGDEVAGVGVVGPVDGAHPAAAEEVTLEVVDAETTAYQLARAHGSSLMARVTACSSVIA